MSPPSEPHPTTFYVQKAMDGDEESWNWVVERLSPLLHAQAEYHLGPELRLNYDPTDLVNDVWQVAFTKLRRQDGRQTPAVVRFLSSTLRNRVRDLVKKHIRGKPKRQGGGGEDSEGLDPVARLPADQSAVSQAAVKGEAQELVTQAIRNLSSEDRELVVLRAIEQQPNKDVAAVMGLEPNTVAVRYRRILQRMREALPGSVFEELSED